MAARDQTQPTGSTASTPRPASDAARILNQHFDALYGAPHLVPQLASVMLVSQAEAAQVEPDPVVTVVRLPAARIAVLAPRQTGLAVAEALADGADTWALDLPATRHGANVLTGQLLSGEHLPASARRVEPGARPEPVPTPRPAGAPQRAQRWRPAVAVAVVVLLATSAGVLTDRPGSSFLSEPTPSFASVAGDRLGRHPADGDAWAVGGDGLPLPIVAGRRIERRTSTPSSIGTLAQPPEDRVGTDFVAKPDPDPDPPSSTTTTTEPDDDAPPPTTPTTQPPLLTIDLDGPGATLNVGGESTTLGL